MPRHAGESVSEVEWRQFGRYLWAGTGETGPVGTIECGHRFTAIDVLGGVVGRCRRLEDAQGLLEHLSRARASAGPRAVTSLIR